MMKKKKSAGRRSSGSKSKKHVYEGTVLKKTETSEVHADSTTLYPAEDGETTASEENSELADEEMWPMVANLEEGELTPLEQPVSDSQNDDLALVPYDEELDKAAAKLGKGDPLTYYLKEISKYELLSLEEEKALTKAFRETGDIEIAKRLVQANLRLVVKIAMEYQRAYQNVLDLIQEGNIGLMKAVSKYDPEKGAKLSYYASWWIRSYILKFILDNFRLVKIGTTAEQKKLFYNLMREKNRLLGMGIQPETKLISENLGVSEKSVELMEERLGQGSGEVSLDRPVFEDKKTTTVADTLASSEEPIDVRLENAQDLEILKNHLYDFMRTLKDRDQEIFKKRLLNEVPDSLQSIADEYGVSRERIRQIEERLIAKLRVYMSEFIR